MAAAGADLGPAGWALLPGLLGPAEVAALREESGSLLAAAALGREGRDEGGSSWGWVTRELGCVLQVAGGGAPAGHAEAYFRRRAEWPHFPGAAAACVCNPRVLQAVRAALPGGAGADLFLVNEQHVVKPPADAGTSAAAAASSAFPVHCDEDWLAGRRVRGAPHYFSLWVALDPTDASNGGLELPGGEGKGLVLIPCAAGDAVLMGSRCPHRSGPNRSDAFRRAYMPQFSSEPLLDVDGGRPVALAVPLPLPQHRTP